MPALCEKSAVFHPRSPRVVGSWILQPRCCFEWIMHASVGGWCAGGVPGINTVRIGAVRKRPLKAARSARTPPLSEGGDIQSLSTDLDPPPPLFWCAGGEGGGAMPCIALRVHTILPALCSPLHHFVAPCRTLALPRHSVRCPPSDSNPIQRRSARHERRPCNATPPSPASPRPTTPPKLATVLLRRVACRAHYSKSERWQAKPKAGAEAVAARDVSATLRAVADLTTPSDELSSLGGPAIRPPAGTAPAWPHPRRVQELVTDATATSVRFPLKFGDASLDRCWDMLGALDRGGGGFRR